MEDLNEDNLVEDIIANYSITPEVPDDNLDPVIPIRPAQALACIHTLQEWEEQQDDSTHNVVKELQALKKRVKRQEMGVLELSNVLCVVRTIWLDLASCQAVVAVYVVRCGIQSD